MIPGKFPRLRPATYEILSPSQLLTLSVSISPMIKSWSGKEPRKLFEGNPSKIPTEIRKRALSKLQTLDATSSLETLGKVPGNRLQALGGDRKGQHSIRVNDQYRLCFVWEDGDAYDVEVADYH